MLSSIRDKLSRVFILVILVINLIATLLVFFYIKPRIYVNRINYYKSIVTPIAENVKIKIFQNIVTGQILASNVTFAISSHSYYTGKLFKNMTENILYNNDYIRGVIYVINFSEEMTLDSILSPFTDSAGIFRAIWYKDYNEQVNIMPYQIELDTFNYSLEIKKTKKWFWAKPFNFRFAGEAQVVQPIVYPIYIGDKYYGFITLLMSVDFVSELIDYNTLPQDVYLFAIDQNGIIINYTLNANILGQDIQKLFPTYAVDLMKIIRKQQELNVKLGDRFIIGHYVKIDPSSYWVIALIVPAKYINQRFIYTLLLLFALALIITIITYFIYRQFTNRLASTANAILKYTDYLYRGRIDNPVPKITDFREIYQLTEKLEKLRLRLVELTQIHRKIGDRVYDQRLNPLDYEDRLAESINYALNRILERWKRRNIIELSKQRTDWINTGLAKIYEATRVEKNSLELLAQKVLDTLIKYTDAYVGGMFALDEEKKKLIPLATFAYEDPKAFTKEIELGEGLVGSVALERKRMYITKIPEDYNVIIIGLGETKPKSIVIQPLIFENELLGVMELAFIRQLEEHELEFIDKAALTISQAIKTIKINIKTQQLLEQSQKQAQELEETRRLLQQHIAELEKREKELRENQARMKGILDAVNHTLMTIEYTTDGILITANEKYLKTMHYTLEELVGVNVLDLVGPEREELEQVIKRVAKGEYFEKVMKRYTKYGEVKWLYSTYTPYYDVDGKITKILYFAFDVTDTYNRIQELEQQVETLKKQIELLEKAIRET